MTDPIDVERLITFMFDEKMEATDERESWFDETARALRSLTTESERLTTENSILRDALLHIIDNDCLNAKWTANNALNTVSSQKS